MLLTRCRVVIIWNIKVPGTIRFQGVAVVYVVDHRSRFTKLTFVERERASVEV
jgi:hypothetical protein